MAGWAHPGQGPIPTCLCPRPVTPKAADVRSQYSKPSTFRLNQWTDKRRCPGHQWTGLGSMVHPHTSTHSYSWAGLLAGGDTLSSSCHWHGGSKCCPRLWEHLMQQCPEDFQHPKLILPQTSSSVAQPYNTNVATWTFHVLGDAHSLTPVWVQGVALGAHTPSADSSLVVPATGPLSCSAATPRSPGLARTL